MLIANLTFYVFASVLVLSALLVFSAKNPVHSVLFLVFAFFNSAGLFVLLNAEFIAMLIVIVYVGAVAVLFLFVVMMLNVDFAELKGQMAKYLPIGVLVAIAMLSELVVMIKHSVASNASMAQISAPMPLGVTNTKALGAILYTNYFYPFQLAGLVLLVAMVGAIVLTHRVREGVRKQSVAEQISRSRKDSIEIVKVQTGKGI
jgi:NADH-quinone oxidoreductase subunit J